jgi:hypothetical protein
MGLLLFEALDDEISNWKTGERSAPACAPTSILDSYNIREV